jgi:hypothetical protein
MSKNFKKFQKFHRTWKKTNKNNGAIIEKVDAMVQ